VKRRLRNVEVEIYPSDTEGEWLVWLVGSSGEGWRVNAEELEALIEPIPEEPEGPKVGDEVDGAWLDDEYWEERYHVVRNPDGSAGSWGRKVKGTEKVYNSDGVGASKADGPWSLLALHPVERWEEPEATPAPPVDPVEEAWKELAGHFGPGASMIRAAVEATVAPLREQVQALSDRVLDLDEQIIDLRNRGETRAVRTVRTVAEKDAAGGEEGPSVEEVLAWLEYLGGDGPMPRLMGDARTFPATAIRLIREGQRDTRAVLTEEMVERACEAACPVGTDCEPWHTRYESHKAWFRRAMRRALLSTGLVREADHGE